MGIASLYAPFGDGCSFGANTVAMFCSSMTVNHINFVLSELAPTVATYYGNRSAAFMMLGTYDKALEDAQNAIKLDENFLKVSVSEMMINYHKVAKVVPPSLH